uniref:Transcriptional repressor n=1 Tax=uncultured Bacillota bacterium TaxID=344338 RepID=A0A650ENQ8_9FIRM|nr:transcriptional repressor [uncultured Firmicutes bacterium]
MIGKKHSIQRETLLNILRGTKTHPTADWIYQEARKALPNISLGTVYRNLALLSESGHILKLNVGTGCDHFDGDTSPHYHFVCNQCGKIIDLETPYHSYINDLAQCDECGTVSGHSLFFHGSCRECLKATKDK